MDREEGRPDAWDLVGSGGQAWRTSAEVDGERPRLDGESRHRWEPQYYCVCDEWLTSGPGLLVSHPIGARGELRWARRAHEGERGCGEFLSHGPIQVILLFLV